MVKELFNWNELDEETKVRVKEDWKKWGIRMGYFTFGVATVYGMQKLGKKLFQAKYPVTAIDAIPGDGDTVNLILIQTNDKTGKKSTKIISKFELDTTSAKGIAKDLLASADIVEKGAGSKAFEKALEASIKTLEENK